jgi:Domain of unknown function (DUF4384)/Caspase domain
MKTNWKAAVAILCTTFGTFLHGNASATNHALILWIGDYQDPGASLPGIDLDGQMARRMALGMGVPEQNIVEKSNQQASKVGIASSIRDLTNRIQANDKVFIYYSGHGRQVGGSNGAKCSEGMVTFDMEAYSDETLESDMKTLAAKASQIVFFNDSCFSGGQVTKSRSSSLAPGEKAKSYYGKLKSSASDSDYVCGDYVNKSARSLQVIAGRAASNMLYVAASADNEVAAATPMGSAATLAWSRCLNASSDRNRSGVLNGREIQACAQNEITKMGKNQTITLVGNDTLPLTFVASVDPQNASQSVSGASALEDIRAGASPDISVSLTMPVTTLKINQTGLDFSVNTSRGGYLYILHIGTRGNDFIQLFPNEFDTNNFIPAGTTSLPKPSWRVRSAGPAGKSYIMAYVSDKPRDFAKALSKSGAFRSGTTNRVTAKSLVAEANGQETLGSGRYGASAIVAFTEE